MALFPATVPADGVSAENYLATQLQSSTGTAAPAAIANAAGVTYTAAQVLGRYIIRSGAAAVSDTLPTAALLLAAMPNPIVGTGFLLDILNNNTGTLTLVAGAGITLAGNTTIATVFNRRYLVTVTNATVGAEAFTIQGLSTAAA